MTFRPLRLVPTLTLGLMSMPVMAGLAGTAIPAFAHGGAALSRLFDWPGLPPAAALSLGTGLASTLLSLALATLIIAGFSGTPLFRLIRRLLARLRQPAHIDRFGDYRGDLTFTPCWTPNGLEIR